MFEKNSKILTTSGFKTLCSIEFLPIGSGEYVSKNPNRKAVPRPGTLPWKTTLNTSGCIQLTVNSGDFVICHPNARISVVYGDSYVTKTQMVVVQSLRSGDFVEFVELSADQGYDSDNRFSFSQQIVTSVEWISKDDLEFYDIMVYGDSKIINSFVFA